MSKCCVLWELMALGEGFSTVLRDLVKGELKGSEVQRSQLHLRTAPSCPFVPLSWWRQMLLESVSRCLGHVVHTLLTLSTLRCCVSVLRAERCSSCAFKPNSGECRAHSVSTAAA